MYNFHGLINENERVIEIVITNLSKDPIAFSLLKTNRNASINNPECLNEANVLAPMRSYCIRADKESKRELVLESLVVIGENGTSDSVSVREAESKKEDLGVYYYLHVIPKSNTKTELLFKSSTYWMCTSFFIMKSKRQEEIYYDRVDPNETDGGRRDPNEADGGYRDLNETDGGCPSRSYRYIEAMEQGVTEDQILDSSVAVMGQGKIVHEKVDATKELFSFHIVSRPTVLSLSVAEDIKFVTFTNQENKMVNKVLVQKAKEILDSIEYDGVINMTKHADIYTSDDCVICADKDPDVVFIQCGHCCSHDECITNTSDSSKKKKKIVICPMCRSRITAFITEKHA